MIEAYPINKGAYELRDAYPYKKANRTYTYRERIREAGGFWSPAGKLWIISEDNLPGVKQFTQVMSRARVAANCHNAESVEWVSETDIERGTTRRTCLYCDDLTGRQVPILEVLS